MNINFSIISQKNYKASCHQLRILKKELIIILHQDDAKLMVFIFCGKGVARTVLVLYKYCLYFRDFVGICFDLVLMWKQSAFCREKHNKSKVSAILEEKWMRVSVSAE